eukprot:TRINITY_DN3564_c0_g4_i2.p5 TRINITY_DN3564_c0_g4~~TRINITY_DN3564_c0_g4_i2.p5  ORF type:complete len:140 (+),score=46.70 TRINITY_DN3564_c0_g4_i2:945-1364(+)
MEWASNEWTDAELVKEVERLKDNVVRQVEINKGLTELQRRQQVMVAEELRRRSKEAVARKVDDGWAPYVTPDGYPYMYNSITKESRWGHNPPLSPTRRTAPTYLPYTAPEAAALLLAQHSTPRTSYPSIFAAPPNLSYL